MKRRPLRILAIDLTAKGFGFVLIEAKRGLLDWGFCSILASDDDAFTKRVREKIARGDPTAIVLENFTSSPERTSALKRLSLIIGITRELRIGVCQVPRKIVSQVLGFRTKDEIAMMLATRFPELRPRLPPERQRWMQEDDRMHIFDALSFALAVIGDLDTSADRP